MGLARTPIYLFSGSEDSITYPAVMRNAVDFFAQVVSHCQRQTSSAAKTLCLAEWMLVKYDSQPACVCVYSFLSQVQESQAIQLRARRKVLVLMLPLSAESPYSATS